MSEREDMTWEDRMESELGSLTDEQRTFLRKIEGADLDTVLKEGMALIRSRAARRPMTSAELTEYALTSRLVFDSQSRRIESLEIKVEMLRIELEAVLEQLLAQQGTLPDLPDIEKKGLKN